MNITVKHGSSDVQLQGLQGSDSIGQLKTRLETVTGLFVRQQKLIFKGKVLAEDGASLESCKLNSGAKLMLLSSGGAGAMGAKPASAPAAKRPSASPAAGRALPSSSTAKRTATATASPSAAAACKPSNMEERRQAWSKTGIVALRDLQLTALDEQVLTGLPAVRAADLSINHLGALPSTISCLQGLQSLRLADNRLTNEGVPWPALASLTGLTSLNLDRNALVILPAALSALTQLSRLTVAENALQEVEEAAAGGWYALQELNLKGNCLAALPNSIGSCNNLVELDVCSNSLAQLPATLSQLQRLQTLRADSNRVRGVPDGLLLGCISLSTLALHDNPITVQELRAAAGFEAYEARRVARCNKQLDGRVLADVDGAFSQGADVQQWQHWQRQQPNKGSK